LCQIWAVGRCVTTSNPMFSITAEVAALVGFGVTQTYNNLIGIS
jgi:hypothetical protein